MSFHHSHITLLTHDMLYFHMTFCSNFSIFADQWEGQMCDHWPMRGLVLTSGLGGWCDIGPGPPVTEPSVVTSDVCRAWAATHRLPGPDCLTARSYKCQCLESCCCWWRRGLAGPAGLSLCPDLAGPNSISAATDTPQPHAEIIKYYNKIQMHMFVSHSSTRINNV